MQPTANRTITDRKAVLRQDVFPIEFLGQNVNFKMFIVEFPGLHGRIEVGRYYE